MLYKLSELFPVVPWTVFKYVTFRSAGAAITALLLSWLLGPTVIEGLRNLKFRQDYQPKDVRNPGDATAAAADLAKRGTPTMGGVLILLVLDISVFLWARPNTLVLLTMLSLMVLAFLGFYDDWLKVSRQNAAGAQSRVKWVVQIVLALVVGVYLWQLPSTRTLVADIQIPFFKDPILRSVPWIGIPLVALTIIGSSNAVNLTDGMDGLAIGCTLIVAMTMLILTYLSDNVKLATYLQIPHVRGASELTVVCAAFIGDTGSLALGGALGIMAVLIHQPLVLLIAGGVFVAEALSVMLQVGWFKYTRHKFGEGRRIFRMAPLHHHFQKQGWKESKIVTRFYIAGILCAVLALSTLKIR